MAYVGHGVTVAQCDKRMKLCCLYTFLLSCYILIAAYGAQEFQPQKIFNI